MAMSSSSSLPLPLNWIHLGCFRSTIARVLDARFRRLKRWDLLWIAWVLLSHYYSGCRSQFVADDLDRSG